MEIVFCKFIFVENARHFPRRYSTVFAYLRAYYREKYAYTLLYTTLIVSGIRFNSDLWSLVLRPGPVHCYNEKWITSVWTGTKKRMDV